MRLRDCKLGSTTVVPFETAIAVAAEGFITYTRTDSPAMDEDTVQEVRQAVLDIYGSDFLVEKPAVYK